MYFIMRSFLLKGWTFHTQIFNDLKEIRSNFQICHHHTFITENILLYKLFQGNKKPVYINTFIWVSRYVLTGSSFYACVCHPSLSTPLNLIQIRRIIRFERSSIDITYTSVGEKYGHTTTSAAECDRSCFPWLFENL